MRAAPASLERLIRALTRLPGIGVKTATRLALYLMRRSPAEARELAEALAGLHQGIRLCSICYTFSEEDPCVLCADPSRDPRLLCVVEEPGDLLVMEKTGVFSGRYHILHGVISPVDGIGPEELRIPLLEARIRRDRVEEVLLGLSSTVPAEATAPIWRNAWQPCRFASPGWPGVFLWAWT